MQAMMLPSCISYLSYIKPQLLNILILILIVVYLIFPTSNRNTGTAKVSISELYILSFLHQTATDKDTTISQTCCISYLSYIKPQLLRKQVLNANGCISYLSYIKPQPQNGVLFRRVRCISYLSYIKPQHYNYT